jgi:hypothetical protein
MIVKFVEQGLEIRALEGPYVEDGVPSPEARRFALELIGRFDEMRTKATEKFLALYNDTWRDEEEGQPVLDEDGFRARLLNPSVTLMDEPGCACVYFEDSDMFAGHSLEVWVDGGQIRDITLVG